MSVPQSFAVKLTVSLKRVDKYLWTLNVSEVIWFVGTNSIFSDAISYEHDQNSAVHPSELYLIFIITQFHSIWKAIEYMQKLYSLEDKWDSKIGKNIKYNRYLTGVLYHVNSELCTPQF